MPASVSRPEETALFLADRCAELEAENARLRDQLRWRDAKTEKPQEGELCLIVMRNMIWPNVIQYSEFGSYRSPWDTDFILYWRPIGPLPVEGGE